jgi:hypothetical protein
MTTSSKKMEWLEELKKINPSIDENEIKKTKIGDKMFLYFIGDESDPMNMKVLHFEAIVKIKQKPNEACSCGSGKKYKKCCA